MRTRSRGRVGAGLTAALTTLTLLLCGCGDGSAGAEPTPATASVPSGPDGSDSPGGGSSPEVPPADGKRVDTSYFSVRVPRGWRVNETVPDLSIVAFGPDLEQISFALSRVLPGRDYTLDELARLQLRLRPWSPKPELVEPVHLAGEPAYHLTGPVGNGFRADAFGLVRGDREILVDIETRGSARVQRETVAAVLATWQWK
ncbi:hypothetical protein GCM10009844_08750 [Nocardioides koreensis]|uniref:Lipoprotein n=1 Tax=Nocardioides koreensis TaxID=433651 RepID=A0ABP5L2F0_9ACTN